MNKENIATIIIGIGVMCIFITVLYFVNWIYQAEVLQAQECVKARELFLGDNNTEGITKKYFGGLPQGCLVDRNFTLGDRR
jgi:uncharacterized membrane protein YukC